ncbi:hypothetical protein EHQ81_03985 [Leptospira selangorensis]|uniref:Uncharacterized protein n=1 Tax=Leptospira selangorensis TaxID=2484982 RepID=A0A5F2C0E0_9LEPT|nr:hypothetical protein [Leptospira selangorensis]TGM15563.1 hypothetical protein EHQ81_03985 [Leptospira selangorensis]TGM18487.1 hypothetical protein EHQ82_15720 [Leptospira selangorensis]
MRKIFFIFVFCSSVLFGNSLQAGTDSNGSSLISSFLNLFGGNFSSSSSFPYSSEPGSEYSGTDANKNVKKYWNLRNKFRNNFIKLSTDKGGCLPMEEVKISLDDPNKRFGKWGDSTIKLGWYLGLLGSELHMLSRPNSYPGYGDGNDIQNAIRELFCAFIALERLDRFGEQSIWEVHPVNVAKYPGTEGYQWPDTPGFFVRDDVPFHVMQDLGLYGAEGDYQTWIGGQALPTPPYNREMSQDQVVHLLLGLAIVKHLVPFTYSYQGMNFRHQAQIYARKLVDYVYAGQDQTYEILGIPVGEMNVSWLITNPVSPKINWFGSCPLCVGWFDPFHPVDPDHMGQVTRGADARFFSAGFNFAGYWVSGKSWNINPQYLLAWGGLSQSAVFTTADNAHMVMALASIGNSWGEPTQDLLVAQAAQHDFYLYPLLHSVLHFGGNISAFLESKTLSFLNSAPWSGTGTESGSDSGWASENRFIRKKDDHNRTQLFLLESHGLDYLLLHNLFFIAKPNQYYGVTPSAQPNSVPDFSVPNWPVPPSYKLPPIGYAVAGIPSYLNTCTVSTSVDIPITIEWDDPHGNRDSVAILLDAQPSSGNGIVTSTGTKNRFVYHGKFWNQWWWEDTVRFRLLDEDGNSTFLTVLIGYPGAVAAPPNIGAVGSPTRIVVNGWFGGIPLYGTIEMEFQVYAIDPNCTPPKPSAWIISGMRNAVAYPISPLRFRAIVGWTIFALHGNAGVTLQAATSVGTTGTYEVPINW